MVGCVIGRSFFARQILTLECYLVGLGGSVGLDRDVSGDLAAGDGIGAVAVILDRDVLAADLRRGLVIIVQRVRRPEGIVFPRRRAQAVGGQPLVQLHGELRLDDELGSTSPDCSCGRILGGGVCTGVDLRRRNHDLCRPRRFCPECQLYDRRRSRLVPAVADDTDASVLLCYRSPFIRCLTGHIGQPRGIIGQRQIVGIIAASGNCHIHDDGLAHICRLIRRSGDRIADRCLRGNAAGFCGFASHGKRRHNQYKCKQCGQNSFFHKITSYGKGIGNSQLPPRSIGAPVILRILRLCLPRLSRRGRRFGFGSADPVIQRIT